MRSGWLFLVLCAACAAAPLASAQPEFQSAQDDFQAALSNQCPDKNLEMLSPSQLRDGLDDYIDALPQDQHDQLKQAEAADCSSMSDGVDCVDLADLKAADKMGKLSDLANWICGAFIRCRQEGDCDYAR